MHQQTPRDGNGRPLGVLFVHGIGEQARGQTLTAFGDALYRWYQRWFGKNRGDVACVELFDTLIETDEQDANTPAHSWLRFTTPGDATAPEPITCLLAESNWADTFTAPRFSEVARWGLVALPWTIVVQFAANLREMAGEYGGALRNYPHMVVGVLFSVMALCLGALTQVLVVLVLILAAIPIPALRRFFIALELKIAATVGDCYVLLESPIRSSAIISRVRRDLDWLADQCGDVAIVAHSQGAAVTHRVLAGAGRNNDPIVSRIRLFFSVGSGLGKLHDVEQTLAPGTHIKWLGPFAMTALILAMMSGPGLLLDLTRRMAERETPPAIGLIGIAAGLAIVLTLGVLSDWSEKHRRKLGLGTLPRLRWVDRYATADPVPSGPLLKDDPAPGQPPLSERWAIDSAAVHNSHSLLSDHTTYLRNEDEFVTSVAVELASCMRLPNERMPRGQTLHDVSRRRRWRVLWLVGIRLVTAAAFFCTLWALRADLPWIGASMAAALNAVWNSVAGVIGDGWATSVVAMMGRLGNPLAAGVVALAIFFLVYYQLVFQIWLWWNRWDTARFFERRDPDYGGPPFVLLVAIAVLAPLGMFIAWMAGYRWESARAVLEILWASRTTLGYALGSWMLFSTIFGGAVAIFLSIDANPEAGGSDLEMWTAALCAAGTAVVSLPAMVWLSILYPAPFRRGYFPEPGSRGLEDLATIAAMVGPPLVAAVIVGLFAATIGDRVGRFLTQQSVAPRRASRARPPHQIGILSCAAGGASVLVSLFLDPSHLSVAGATTVVCLWLVAGLASINAMARSEARSWAERLAYGGVGLSMLSLTIHAR